MGNLQEETMITTKSSTCEEEELTKMSLLQVSLKHLNLEKPRKDHVGVISIH